MARWQAMSDPPYSLALVTNISNRDGRGAHTALIIDGPERAVFNPAGTWSHPQAPERGDFHAGFTPEMEKWFIDYHARETYRVQIQRVAVDAATAQAALERARGYGAVSPTGCTIAVTRILRGLPGFEEIPVVLFPDRAARAFGALPGVETLTYLDDSPGDWSDLPGRLPAGGEIRTVPPQDLARAVDTGPRSR